jgi:DNA-binding response OmpR family regulator
VGRKIAADLPIGTRWTNGGVKAMKKKILIVDDEREIVSYLSRKLAKEDYEPLAAYDGREGLAVMKEQKIDAVIMDSVMSEIDGYALCQMIKASPVFSHIPILICTAYANNEKEFRKLGIDDYIVKPFTFENLFASLTRVFNRISQNIKFKKVLVQTNQRASIEEAVRQIEEYGFRIDVVAIPEDSNIIEETIRHQPDIVVFNALRENKFPEIMVHSLKSYVEFKDLKIILYVDSRGLGRREKEFHLLLQELKGKCLGAGANGWVDRLDRESFLNVLFEYCKG